jgi:hypothetical protein
MNFLVGAIVGGTLALAVISLHGAMALQQHLHLLVVNTLRSKPSSSFLQSMQHFEDGGYLILADRRDLKTHVLPMGHVTFGHQRLERLA